MFFYILSSIITLFIVLKIYNYIDFRKNPRKRINKLGHKLYNKLANLEWNMAKHENREPQYINIWIELYYIFISTLKPNATYELQPELVIYELSENPVRYGLNILKISPYIQTLSEKDPLFDIWLLENIQNLPMSAQLVLVKITEEYYGIDEAAKYIIDILTGKLK